MLILSRKLGEQIVIGSEITVTVLEIHGNRIKLGVQGPAEVPIHRHEVHCMIAGTSPAFERAECA